MFRPHKAVEYQHHSQDFSLLRILSCQTRCEYSWRLPSYESQHS